ncbi:MAG: hypothetical protein ACJA2Q_002770 [Pseudohongiellaceae bacterium]|jgi:hypothetical protein
MGQFSGEPVLSVQTSKGITVDIYSEIAPLDINRIHSWQLRLTDAQGSPVSNAQIELVGGMPEHDHGMPTQPQITAETETGSYLLEGMRFHMPGKWLLDIKLTYAVGTEELIVETTKIEFEL